VRACCATSALPGPPFLLRRPALGGQSALAPANGPPLAYSAGRRAVSGPPCDRRDPGRPAALAGCRTGPAPPPGRPRPPVSCPPASAGALKLIFPVMVRHPAPRPSLPRDLPPAWPSRAPGTLPGTRNPAGHPEPCRAPGTLPGTRNPAGQLARAPPHGPRRPHPAPPYQDQPGLRGVFWSPGVF
jgi:hypothetical protein